MNTRHLSLVFFWCCCCLLCLFVLLPLCAATGAGKALYFDNAVTYRVKTPLVSGLQDGFSMSFWARFHRPGDSAGDNFAGYSGVLVSFVDEAESQNVFQFAEYNVMVLMLGPADSISVFDNGDDVDWHQYGFSYNDTSGIFVFYRDGEVTWNSLNGTHTFSQTSFMQTGYFLLGNSLLSSDTPFAGFLDEFCVWNTTISTETMKAVEMNGCNGFKDNLVMRLGFDNDRTLIPDIWNDVTNDYYASTGIDLTCGEATTSGAYPVHVFSTAPFQSDDAPHWVVVPNNSSTNIEIPCHGCSQIKIESLPAWGNLISSSNSTTLGLSDFTEPRVIYEPNSANFTEDSFTFSFDGITSTVMLKLNTPPTASDFTLTLLQNNYLIPSLPINHMSIDLETGSVSSTKILSFSHSSSISLFQFNNAPNCDTTNWNFYTCIATPENEITTFPVTISDRFLRIGMVHSGNTSGYGLMNITYRVSDGMESSVLSHVVGIDVTKVNRHPVPEDMDVSVLEDDVLDVELVVNDPDGDEIYSIVSSLPQFGTLYQVDEEGTAGLIVTLEASSPAIDQWAESATASSQWDDPVNHADQIAGVADVYPLHGDMPGAWQPKQSGDFIHPWVQINITTSVYLTSVDVYETWHPGSIVRVSAYYEDTQSWRVVWEGDSQVTLLNPDPTVTKSNVWTVNLCPVVYKSRMLRFDMDLVDDAYWIGWDAVNVRGSVGLTKQAVANPNRHLKYKPNLNYNGDDSFSFTVLDCPFFLTYRTLYPEIRTASVAITVVPVNDPPVAQAVVATLFDGPHNSVNISLVATDVDDTNLSYSITRLPRTGTLFNENGVLIVAPTALPGTSNMIVYKPSKITTYSKAAQLIDFGFAVTDPNAASNANSVTVTIQSCMFSNYTYIVSSDCDYNSLARSISYSWPTDCNAYDSGMSSVSCDYIPANSAVGVAVIVITCLVAFMCFGWLHWLVVNRALPIVRAAQFLICVLFVAGACTLCLSNLVFLGANTDFLCMGRAWLFHATFTFLFGPLVMKIWRAYQILQNSSFKRRVISNTEVLKWLACMSLVDIFLLALWTGIAPVQAHTHTTNTTIGPIRHQVCAHSHKSSSVFAILLATYKVLMCVLACFWSYQTRNVNQQFAESKHIMFAVYNTGLMGGIVSFVIYGAGVGGASAILLHTVAVCISVTASVVVVLLPKYFSRALTTQDLIASNPSAVQTSSKRNSLASKNNSFNATNFSVAHVVTPTEL